MSIKNTAMIGATTITLAVGINQMLAPSTPEEFHDQQRQQQVEYGSDADEANRDRHRDAGNDHGAAESDQKNRPGEHRPPEPDGPRIRLRLP